MLTAYSKGSDGPHCRLKLSVRVIWLLTVLDIAAKEFIANPGAVATYSTKNIFSALALILFTIDCFRLYEIANSNSMTFPNALWTLFIFASLRIYSIFFTEVSYRKAYFISANTPYASLISKIVLSASWNPVNSACDPFFFFTAGFD